jgi:formate dehydrogenase alpha subunit
MPDYDYELHTTCPHCSVGCTLNLHVKDNHIVKATLPFEDAVSVGNLCQKARLSLDGSPYQNRLTAPLVRKNGELAETTWDKALDLVAERFAAIHDESGPDALAFLASAACTNEANYLMQKFARAVIGTNSVDHRARFEHSSTLTGLKAAFGSGAMTNSIADLDQSHAIFVIGSDITRHHPLIGQAVKRAACDNGAALIVADPRRIELAAFADLHLRHQPGTDIALLNGIAHVILRDGLAAEEFIAGRTENFDAWCAVIDDYSPERASQITGVTAADIERAAHLYAENHPAAILYAAGITRHPYGQQNVLALANLGMATGNVGLVGGGVNPLLSRANAQGACDMGSLPNVFSGYQRVADEAARARFEQGWGVSLSGTPGLTLGEIVDAAGEGALRGLWIMGEDPAISDPERLERTEFLVMQGAVLGEIAQLADVVLPAASFAEQEGTFTNTERRVQRVRAAVEPPPGARPDWRIIADLAKRTRARVRVNGNGNGAGWDYASPAAIMDEIAGLTPIYGGISYTRLEDSANLPGLQWPCTNEDHPCTSYLHKDRFIRGLGRFHPVHHQHVDEFPNDAYPLTLTTGHPKQGWHTRSIIGQIQSLEFMLPKEPLEINPADASILGILDGDWATIRSRCGEVRARAWLRERIRPGTVSLPFHLAESLGNVQSNAALDPVAKTRERKVCAVLVEKVEMPEPVPGG